MKLLAVVGLVVVLSLSVGVGVWAQEVPGGGPVLAVAVNGEIAVRGESKPETQQHILLPGQSAVVATWRVDVDLTLPVLGMVLRGPASITMELRQKSVLLARVQSLSGEAQNVVLHGLGGDATVSLSLTGAADVAAVPVQIRGTGGTGMFDGVRIVGVLKGFYKPQGTLYLGYPSPEAALNAIQRGLNQNTSLSDAQRLETLEHVKQAIAQAQVTTFPTEAELAAASQPTTTQAPPTQADVTATIQRSGAFSQAQVMLQIVVGAGDAHQAVKVVAAGSDGSAKTIYEGVHAPGERVSASASGTPPFVVLVYVAGIMVKQITVPVQ